MTCLSLVFLLPGWCLSWCLIKTNFLWFLKERQSLSFPSSLLLSSSALLSFLLSSSTSSSSYFTSSFFYYYFFSSFFFVRWVQCTSIFLTGSWNLLYNKLMKNSLMNNLDLREVKLKSTLIFSSMTFLGWYLWWSYRFFLHFCEFM